MASSKYQSARIRIIDRELQRKHRVKTKDLVKLIRHELDINVSSRTVQTDISLMKDDSALGYFAPIEYSKKEKSWYYSDPNYTITTHNLKDHEIKSLSFCARLLSVYREVGIFSNFSNAIEKVLDAVKIQESSTDDNKMDSLIHVDQYPQNTGGKFIPKIMTALQEERIIRFTYQKFANDNTKEHVIQPYLLKSYEYRWYLLGKPENSDIILTFGLDRIIDLEVQDFFFKREKIDFNKYFQNTLGITVTRDEPKLIILSFTPNQGKYIKTLPLHSTQKVLVDNNKELRISVFIKPAYEFYAKILSYCDSVKVISPQEIADEVRIRLEKAIHQYLK